MKTIRTLDSTGIGKSLLIIGGGTSVGQIDFTRIPEHMVKWSINDAVPWRMLPEFAKHPLSTYVDAEIDYILYNDVCAGEVLKQLDIDGIPLITFNGHHIPGTEYTYRLDDFRHLKVNIADSFNTGLKALVFAKRLMKFDAIYLAGFDFYCDETSGARVSHFFGDSVGEKKKYAIEQNRDCHFRRLKAMIKQFDNLPDVDGIFNCNAGSLLMRYPHRLPYKE